LRRFTEELARLSPCSVFGFNLMTTAACSPLDFSSPRGKPCFYRPWIVMAAANARAEAAIITRSGFTADFADFAIAVPSDRRKRGAYFLQND
jgi:hypothetical protein